MRFWNWAAQVEVEQICFCIEGNSKHIQYEWRQSCIFCTQGQFIYVGATYASSLPFLSWYGHSNRGERHIPRRQSIGSLFKSACFVVEWTGVSTGNKNTILVIVNYVVLGSIEISVAMHFTIYFRVVCDRTESFRH
jgi:hypothetical protein